MQMEINTKSNKMQCRVAYFLTYCLFIGFYADEANPYYQFLIELSQVNISAASVNVLNEMTAEPLGKFKELFPDSNIAPKSIV